MILTGKEIEKRLGTDIVIEPYNEKYLNPNSYNLCLHNELMVYEEIVLDMARQNRLGKYVIPEEGMVLYPGQLYLGRTVERTETHNLAPLLEGRSSIGRLGISVHATAGVGDIGFCGYWTLEITVAQPVRIYAGIPICQIIYHTVEGEIVEYNSDKYQNNKGIQPSLLFKELNPNENRQMRLSFGEEKTSD